MSFLATIGYIILDFIIIAIVFICIIVLMMYCVASGIAYKKETEISAWDYWETHKSKSWTELSGEEKEKMLIANLIIADDVGAVVTKEKLTIMLEEQLPISEPHVGLSYPMDC